MRALWVLLFVMLTTPAGSAQKELDPEELIRFQVNGSMLQSMCRDAIRSLNGESIQRVSLVRAGKCSGYVAGAMDSRFAWEEVAKQKLFCMPEGVSGEQPIRIVAKYLEQHPDELHLPAATLVIFAFVGAFPCPAK